MYNEHEWTSALTELQKRTLICIIKRDRKWTSQGKFLEYSGK